MAGWKSRAARRRCRGQPISTPPRSTPAPPLALKGVGSIFQLRLCRLRDGRRVRHLAGDGRRNQRHGLYDVNGSGVVALGGQDADHHRGSIFETRSRMAGSAAASTATWSSSTACKRTWRKLQQLYRRHHDRTGRHADPGGQRLRVGVQQRRRRRPRRLSAQTMSSARQSSR